jgi:hypothetical protein
MTSPLPRSEIVALLASAGYRGPFSVARVAGGGNNRVFHVRGSAFDAALKIYFQHPNDTRDRLAAEFAFSHFAWNHGLRCLPRPMSCDLVHHLGLYEFVKGRRPTPDEIDSDAVRQAAAMIQQLSLNKASSDATNLPPGAEACFSIRAHLACVTRRVERLRKLDWSASSENDSAIDVQAAAFVEEELFPAWSATMEAVERRAAEICLPLDEELPRNDRCLSPSDFGFHNALVTPEGIKFIDFEYAGWDDPAKLVCDFFCQPALPVSMRHFKTFLAAVVENTTDPKRHEQRIELLLPVYRLKWCCILLNEFLPVDAARRQFAYGSHGVPQTATNRKRQQVAKARQLLQESRQPAVPRTMHASPHFAASTVRATR